MKNVKKLLIVVCLIAFAFIITGCNKTTKTASTTASTTIEGTTTKKDEIPTIKLTADKNKLKKGESATLTVETTGTDKGYTIMVTNPTLLKVEGTTIEMIGDTSIDKNVVVTAMINDSDISDSITIKCLAPIIDGQVGELTTAMLQEIGNDSITVTGVVKDVYTNFQNSMKNSTHRYDMTVWMEDGAWMGTWNEQGSKVAITDSYRRGEKDGVVNHAGEKGHALESVYVNLQNQIATKEVKDYMSYPTIWESQHLWNHLGNLNINKFTYDADNDVYAYTIDVNDMDTLYLMTYMSYSLTPMLEDTLMNFYLIIENGKVTKIKAQTEVLYYGADTREDAEAMSYTEVELTLSDIGTTEVAGANVFEAPQHADLLTQAIDQIKNAKSYMYETTDTTTYAPTADESDYMANDYVSDLKKLKVQNYTSQTGKVGQMGIVTENAILIATTGAYSSYLDGDDPYHTEYSGYLSNNDGTYEFFEYDYVSKSLKGSKINLGNMNDVVTPKFNISANIFKFKGTKEAENGYTLYTFQLIDSTATRDFAVETSLYSYAKSAKASSSRKAEIVVDEEGRLISITYPYDTGVYAGYCTTTFSNIGTAELEADTFDGYIHKTFRTSWKEFMVKYYRTEMSTLVPSIDKDAEYVFQAVFGDDAKDIISPDKILGVVGDNIAGPFYDWKEIDKDEQGKPINRDYVSFNIGLDEYDENLQITDEYFFHIVDELTKVFTEDGYTLSAANTSLFNRGTKSGSRYFTFIKGGIEIVFEQNQSNRFLYVSVYRTGDWTLTK